MRKGKNAPTDNNLINNEMLGKAAHVLRSVNHDLRAKILTMLFQQERMTVTEIYIKLRVEQSVASQHLAILREAGVVCAERQGKNIYYSLNQKRLEQINCIVHDLVA